MKKKLIFKTAYKNINLETNENIEKLEVYLDGERIYHAQQHKLDPEFEKFTQNLYFSGLYLIHKYIVPEQAPFQYLTKNGDLSDLKDKFDVEEIPVIRALLTGMKIISDDSYQLSFMIYVGYNRIEGDDYLHYFPANFLIWDDVKKTYSKTLIGETPFDELDQALTNENLHNLLVNVLILKDGQYYLFEDFIKLN